MQHEAAESSAMSSSLVDSLRGLVELQKLPDGVLPFDPEALINSLQAHAFEHYKTDWRKRSPSPVESAEPVTAKLFEYRGQQVAGFEVNGLQMICLPQVYELFLKTMVGGLHTVYTKLKRLDISPLVCNVEQVRALRSLGAIQPGVNRCKLIAAEDFDRLFDDCTNSCPRPGRPPKRASTEPWPGGEAKLERAGGGGEEPRIATDFPFGGLLPHLTAQQLLVQHMQQMMAAAVHSSHSDRGEPSESPSPLPPQTESTPLNLTKQSNSETSDSDSLERKPERGRPSSSPQEESCSPSEGRASDGSSSSSDSSSFALNKVLTFIDLAQSHFDRQQEFMKTSEGTLEQLRQRLEESVRSEQRLREELEAERRKSRLYLRRYRNVKKEAATSQRESST